MKTYLSTRLLLKQKVETSNEKKFGTEHYVVAGLQLKYLSLWGLNQ